MQTADDRHRETTDIEGTVPTQTLFNQGDLHGTYDATGSTLVAPIWTDSNGLNNGTLPSEILLTPTLQSS
jgi:hypothetical protein